MPIAPSRRPARLSLATLLNEQIDELNGIVAEIDRGLRGPGHYDELEQRADEAARGIRAAFREKAARR